MLLYIVHVKDACCSETRNTCLNKVGLLTSVIADAIIMSALAILVDCVECSAIVYQGVYFPMYNLRSVAATADSAIP